jgi:RNA polymerase sigma factor (sigma-70 family)
VSGSPWRNGEFDLFYKATLEKVYARSRTLVAIRQDAEDLTQRAYVEALCSSVLHGLAPGQQVTWMCTTVTRMASRDWRRIRRLEELAPSLYEPGRGDAPDPEDAALAALSVETCLQAIRKMSPRKRAITVLRWVDGYNSTEIAGLLDVNAGTVRREIKEIRDGLHPLVDPHSDSEAEDGKTEEETDRETGEGEDGS